MPAAIIGFVAKIGVASIAATGGALAGSPFLIGAAVIVAGAAAFNFVLKKVMAIDMPEQDASRDVTARSTTEPIKIIYGEALVSGPISFLGTAGTRNRDLYHAIALAAHEVESITDVYLDGEKIQNSDINSGDAAGGDVSAGTFAPKDSTTLVRINKHLGTPTQAADTNLVSAFTAYTSAHQGKGIAYITTKFTLSDESQEVWDKHAPRDIKAVVKGRKVYDPRLEVTAGGTAGASPTNDSYIAFSDNPALCAADYMMNSVFGMAMATGKIDWASVISAADTCDVSVSIPGSTTEKRFTCNGVVYGATTHKENIDRILSSMNGQLIYSMGVFYINAGAYIAPTISLSEDDLAGPISLKTSYERNARFNTVIASYIDPDQKYKPVDTTPMFITSAVNRDAGETLKREIKLPMTNSSYMAQRISNKLIQISDQQKSLVFPCNLKGLNVKPGDRVQLTISDLSYSNKVFEVLSWAMSDMGGGSGVQLTLREDDSGSYADPDVSWYSTVSATGTIDAGFPGVPGPSALTATATIEANELNWVNPTESEQFNEIQVFASPNSSWSSAVKIAQGRMTSYRHDASTAADAITAGTQRYYWVRAARYGDTTTTDSISDRNPDNDTSTINATVGVNDPNFSDIVDNTGTPNPPGTVTLEETTTLSPDGTLLSALKVSWAAPSSTTYLANYDVQYKKTSESQIDYGLVSSAYTSTINYGSVADATTVELNYGNVSDSVPGGTVEYSSMVAYDRVATITNLDPLEEYTIRVRQVTRTGTVSDYSTATITLQGDQTAPGVPTSVTATGGFQSIILNWQNPTADDLAYVEIFESETDNVNAATLYLQSYTDNFTRTGLGVDTTRYYFLRSVDRSGNNSAFTSSVNATTSSIVMDDLAQAVQDEFAAGNAFGIEPVSTLSGVTGDHVGQIKYLTTTATLYVWTGSAWSTDLYTASSVSPGSITAASFASSIEPLSVVSSLPTVSGYTGPNVVFLTTDQKLYRLSGGAWTTSIAAADLSGTVDSANFPSTLRPVEILGALPTSDLTQGRTVLLTTNNKFYRYTGSEWTAGISATDLTDQIDLPTQVTGNLQAANIAAGSISTSKLIASEFETDTAVIGAIQTGVLTASAITTAIGTFEFVETDNIAANQITGGKIAASDVITNTAQISSGVIQSANIADATIVTADIADAQITTLKIGENQVTVPASVVVTPSLAGDGTLAVRATLTIDTDVISPLLISWTIEQGYTDTSGQGTKIRVVAESQATVSSTVYITDRTADYLRLESDFMAGSGVVQQTSAGTTTIKLYWAAEDSTTKLNRATITAIASQR